jgi:hypothetical protein
MHAAETGVGKASATSAAAIEDSGIIAHKLPPLYLIKRCVVGVVRSVRSCLSIGVVFGAAI